MVTNVTQRNEVLRELLRWHSEKGRLAANRLSTTSHLPDRRMSCMESSWRTPNRPTTSSPCSAIRTSCHLRGGAPMIYLIVDGELVDILTEMDEALAEHAGKVEIADLVTGRRTIIKQARKGNRR